MISYRQADLLDTLRTEDGKSTFELEFHWFTAWRNIVLKKISPVTPPIAGAEMTLNSMVQASPTYKKYTQHGSVKNKDASWKAVREICADMAKRYKKTTVGNPKEAFDGIFLVEVEIDLS
jgi:hypothetical protein